MSTQSRLGRSAVSRLSRLHAAQGGNCFYCGNAITVRLPGEEISAADTTIDHFFPKSAGGLDGWGNWVLACKRCNHTKANRQPTRDEMQAWNELARAWPIIRPIEMELVQKKRCVSCGGWISAMRLGESIRAGAETSTCRPRCGRGSRRRRIEARLRLVRERVGEPTTKPELGKAPSFERRIPGLTWLRGLVRRIFDIFRKD